MLSSILSLFFFSFAVFLIEKRHQHQNTNKDYLGGEEEEKDVLVLVELVDEGLAGAHSRRPVHLHVAVVLQKPGIKSYKTLPFRET